MSTTRKPAKPLAKTPVKPTPPAPKPAGVPVRGKVVPAGSTASATAALPVTMSTTSPPFNRTTFRAQLPLLCASGAVWLNCASRDEYNGVVEVSRDMGYDVVEDTERLRVEVRRRP